MGKKKITVYWGISDSGFWNRVELQSDDDPEIDEIIRGIDLGDLAYRDEDVQNVLNSIAEKYFKDYEVEFVEDCIGDCGI